jgi:signal transduction histidine kinase
LNVNLEPLLVDTVINPCLTQMEPLALERGVSLDMAGTGGLGAIADRQRLMQILTNLVSNAIKFTPAGGSVTVLRESDDRAVRLTVADTGKGIPPDKLEFVFDEFAQIESSQSEPSEGTGLGLPLSRRLAELLGGSIELKSEVGRGSAFTVTLARAGSRAIPDASTSGSTGLSKSTYRRRGPRPTTSAFVIGSTPPAPFL